MCLQSPPPPPPAPPPLCRPPSLSTSLEGFAMDVRGMSEYAVSFCFYCSHRKVCISLLPSSSGPHATDVFREDDLVLLKYTVIYIGWYWVRLNNLLSLHFWGAFCWSINKTIFLIWWFNYGSDNTAAWPYESNHTGRIVLFPDVAKCNLVTLFSNTQKYDSYIFTYYHSTQIKVS